LVIALDKECVSYAPLVWPVAISTIKKMDLEVLVKQCFGAWGGEPRLPWIIAASKDRWSPRKVLLCDGSPNMTSNLKDLADLGVFYSVNPHYSL
jgi:hypothetical protein